MQIQKIVAMAAVSALLVASTCLAQAPAAAAKDATAVATAPVKAQATCPVMGGKINKALFCDVEGKRLYVCCGGCIKTIQKDPAKYIKILEDQGVTLEKAPAPAEAAKTPAAEPAKAPAAAK
jgi:hypothetical protein